MNEFGHIFKSYQNEMAVKIVLGRKEFALTPLMALDPPLQITGPPELQIEFALVPSWTSPPANRASM